MPKMWKYIFQPVFVVIYDKPDSQIFGSEPDGGKVSDMNTLVDSL